MRVLLIDDERLARQELRRLLGHHPEWQVVGEARNVDEGLQAIERLNPDVVFLDIEMPGGSGFDLLERLEQLPEVIFTTAYDEYAVKAFEVNALDYLVKPIEPERLASALLKVTERRNAMEREEAGRGDLLTEKDRVFVRDGRRCWLVRLQDVSLFESEGNYTRLHFKGKRPLIRRSLHQLDRRLDPRSFFRANRRQILNLNKVVSVEPLEQRRLIVVLEQEIEVELSRRRARSFQERLSL